MLSHAVLLTALLEIISQISIDCNYLLKLLPKVYVCTLCDVYKLYPTAQNL